jgi:hypothetical protein
MMNPTPEARDIEFYDAEFTRIAAESDALIFTTATGATHRLKLSTPPWWPLGTVGRLRLSADESSFSFKAYPDQRIRRLPAEDDGKKGLWGWRIGQLTFSCKAGVIPGRGGVVVSEDTETLVLQIPREFVDFCATSRLRPDTVLRGFIADLCELMNWSHCPREDGYSSNGSDESQMAQQYFKHAYPWD